MHSDYLQYRSNDWLDLFNIVAGVTLIIAGSQFIFHPLAGNSLLAVIAGLSFVLLGLMLLFVTHVLARQAYFDEHPDYAPTDGNLFLPDHTL